MRKNIRKDTTERIKKQIEKPISTSSFINNKISTEVASEKEDPQKAALIYLFFEKRLNKRNIANAIIEITKKLMENLVNKSLLINNIGMDIISLKFEIRLLNL